MFLVNTLKNYLPLILIILLASFLRLWMLDQVPVAMSDDEIREIYTSYSISQTGRDAFGNFMPLVIAMDGFSTYGQVPIYGSSLLFLILPLNPFTGRLPHAISGILSVLFFYFIIKKLFKNEMIAILSSAALSVSVWHIQLSRFAIETNMTFLLYLIGICIFLYSKSVKALISSMVFFVLAFYSYSAFKVIFLPMIVILVWYRLKELTKEKLLIILATVIFAFSSFGILSITQNAANYGGSPFFFSDKTKTSLNVEFERRASDAPHFIENLYHNKYTYLTRMFLENYAGAFSPHYLFLNQEASGIYSIWGRGELYFFESVFLLAGFLYMFLKKRKEFYFILLLLLISPLPSALGVGSPTWTSRSAFMIFPLYALLGFGIYSFINIFKDKRLKIFVSGLILILYLYSVLGYTTQYYYDWSRTNAKYFSKSTKDLVYFINNSEKKEILVSGVTVNTFMHYAFYNKLDPNLVHSSINNNPIRFNNITFAKECLIGAASDPYKSISENQIYIAAAGCRYKTKPKMQIKTYNGEEVMWNIYEK